MGEGVEKRQGLQRGGDAARQTVAAQTSEQNNQAKATNRNISIPIIIIINISITMK